MRSLIKWHFLIILVLISPSIHCSGAINTNQVYTYQRLTKDLNEIDDTYNNETEIHSIGRSHFGRNIWAVKLGKGKTNLLLIGAHHGREWLTTSLLMKMLEQYAHSYQTKQSFGPYSSDVFDQVSIWFIPMLNPDGVSIQQQGIHAAPTNQQRKLFSMNAFSPDFSQWKANGIGVDLNRQYPAGWQELKNGPSVPWYQFYKGNQPIEAKEVNALVSFTNTIKPELALAYHSSGREIFWKYKNNNKNLRRDRLLAKKVSQLTNYRLSKPDKNAIGGGFTDWFISTHHKPGMTIEISYPVGETNPPLSIFSEEWKRNKLVGLMLVTEIAKQCK